MAFSNDTVVPKIISAHMRQSFNESTVYSAHTNRAWESELTGGPGDRVVINVPSAASAVGDHAIGTALVYTEVDVGTPVTLTMDKKKEFKLMYNDINALQSIPDVMAEAGLVQGRHLAEQIDKDVFTVMTNSFDWRDGSYGSCSGVWHRQRCSGHSLDNMASYYGHRSYAS